MPLTVDVSGPEAYVWHSLDTMMCVSVMLSVQYASKTTGIDKDGVVIIDKSF